VAVALGLPGKIGGHGAEVAAMVGRGELEQVRAYCEADCLNLFVLHVRWALLTGKVGAAGHNASLESLVRCLEEERGGRPHLGEFLDRWRAFSRPVPMFVPDGRAKRETAPLDDDRVA
jgi:3'-5' exonuclease